MNYRPLGETGRCASEVGFGVWTVASTMWGITDEAFGVQLLRQALEAGINCFDTADVYGDGKGETMLATALGNHREEAVICTKFGYDFYQHPGIQPGQRERPHDWTPDYVKIACEKSLKRLATDRIDLYQLHNPRLDALQSDDLIAVLETLKTQGKILAYGAALGPALKPERQIEEGVYCARIWRAPVQIIYNLLEQVLGESIFPIARQNQSGVFVRVPHASGLLEGNYSETTTFEANDHRSFRLTSDGQRKQWLLDGLRKIETLKGFTRETGRTLGQLALQFILSEPSVISVFPNIYDANQLRDFTQASCKHPLTASELAALADLYANNFRLDADQAPFDKTPSQ